MDTQIIPSAKNEMNAKQRKTLARKLIKAQNESVKTVSAYGREVLLEDGYTVCFHDYNNRLTYLGERDPQGNFS